MEVGAVEEAGAVEETGEETDKAGAVEGAEAEKALNS